MRKIFNHYQTTILNLYVLRNILLKKTVADLVGKKEEDIAHLRRSKKISPDFKLVDTCAAEFEAQTPYYYSTYDRQ